MSSPNGAVAGNAQNIPEAHTPRTRSTFPLHYHFFNTHRFGELVPHYVEDANKDESFPIHSSFDLRSYTLESPLMQNVRRNKDYFMVPMEAILPLNWEKFFDNPVRGDDVLDDVGPGVENFWAKVYTFVSSLSSALSTYLGTAGTTNAQALQAILRYLILVEYFYSNGNLLASLGCHGANYCDAISNSKKYSFDYFFDTVLDAIVTDLGSDSFNFTLDGSNYTVVVDPKQHFNNSAISLRHALDLMRDNPTFVINSWTGDSGFKANMVTLFGAWSITPINASVDCDLSRLWAYQLCCAHYMTNDHIDFVYSADLYRQLIGFYVASIYSGSWPSSLWFTRNAIKYQYDYLSAKVFSTLISSASSSTNPTSILSTNAVVATSCLGYFSALFAYRKSLRYLDYFTGSRAQPLAVVTSGISTNVAVNSNQVSVIDITKSIQAQRFLNSVNRVRHSFEGYLKGIFGGKMPAPDYHNPFYLAHTDDVVYGQETENTGAAQMSDDIAVTTNFRGHSNKYMFDCRTDRNVIIIGITSYDITRVYGASIERAFFKKNRFDYFNPFMQYTGDQPIYEQELGSSRQLMSNFSYTTRHMEYKQRYSQAAGGFIERLPGWLFLMPKLPGSQSNINPDFIRSHNSEFDRFYVKLTGWSNGTYFHFIVDDYNSVNASRPMAFAPQILG